MDIIETHILEALRGLINEDLDSKHRAVAMIDCEADNEYSSIVHIMGMEISASPGQPGQQGWQWADIADKLPPSRANEGNPDRGSLPWHQLMDFMWDTLRDYEPSPLFGFRDNMTVVDFDDDGEPYEKEVDDRYGLLDIIDISRPESPFVNDIKLKGETVPGLKAVYGGWGEKKKQLDKEGRDAKHQAKDAGKEGRPLRGRTPRPGPKQVEEARRVYGPRGGGGRKTPAEFKAEHGYERGADDTYVVSIGINNPFPPGAAQRASNNEIGQRVFRILTGAAIDENSPTTTARAVGGVLPWATLQFINDPESPVEGRIYVLARIEEPDYRPQSDDATFSFDAPSDLKTEIDGILDNGELIISRRSGGKTAMPLDPEEHAGLITAAQALRDYPGMALDAMSDDELVQLWRYDPDNPVLGLFRNYSRHREAFGRVATSHAAHDTMRVARMGRLASTFSTELKRLTDEATEWDLDPNVVVRAIYRYFHSVNIPIDSPDDLQALPPRMQNKILNTISDLDVFELRELLEAFEYLYDAIAEDNDELIKSAELLIEDTLGMLPPAPDNELERNILKLKFYNNKIHYTRDCLREDAVLYAAVLAKSGYRLSSIDRILSQQGLFANINDPDLADVYSDIGPLAERATGILSLNLLLENACSTMKRVVIKLKSDNLRHLNAIAPQPLLNNGKLYDVPSKDILGKLSISMPVLVSTAEPGSSVAFNYWR